MEFEYSISKRMEIAGAHRLSLDYESKCQNLHGHNWIITVFCGATHLNHNGMVVDFKDIKRVISERLDHQVLNEVLPDINPTAENIATWVLNTMNDLLNHRNSVDGSDAKCYKVTVQESEGNVACATLGGCGGRL